MPDYIGRRVGRWREIAGLTQQELADAVGVSRPYISLIESGKKAVTKRALLINLAGALGVSVSQLLDQPPQPRDVEDLVMSRAAAAVRIALDGDGPVSLPIPRQLPNRADEIISLRAACDYPALAERLPTLVTDAQAVAFEAVNEDERRIGLDVFVKACVFGALALKTSGYVDLAVRLAERGQAAADQLGSPVHVAAARFALCQGLMAEGVRRRALAIASRSADELTTQLASADGAQGWYVHLRLQAALSAASLGDHAQAAGHLQDAAEVATRPAGPDLWHRDDLATNVDIWRITVALENGGNLENGGDPERAPDLARRVDRSKLRIPQRLARLYMDTGRGHFARGDRGAAVNAFQAAHDTAPGEVRNRGSVREIVSQMIRDTSRIPGDERLQRLAARLGMDPAEET
jgi:transcriptional regulator with XRE-family HTH domain